MVTKPKINIGDLFEIETSKGFAYFQYCYKSENLGELIRILPETFTHRPDSFDKIVAEKESFMVFFPVLMAYRKKIIHLVANVALLNFEKPKFMREECLLKDEPECWYIVDTSTWKRTKVKELTPEQQSLSPWGIWNDTLLIERIEEGWSLDKWK
jgi:hypothetical protein